MFASETHDLPSVDLNLIDSDHEELARRTEAVRAAITFGDSEQVGRTVEQLRDFALTHYGLEESMMIASRYPHTREHIRMHQRLIGVLSGIVYRTRFADARLTEGAIGAVEELHQMHVHTDDARFGQWLSGRPA
jgi:hemerythrin-like metal-binding protein